MRQQPESPTHRTVDTGEVRLAVTERGDSRQPAVLLVHGYPDTSSVWDEVAADLVGRFHVITYDVRGAGSSSAPRDARGYRLARLAADIAAVIDEVSPDRPVHLVGHDWGAIQAWEAVAQTRLAGRIASLTSVGGPSIDQVSAWLRRRAVSGPRGLADVAGQLGRWWYIGFFLLPVLPELAWRGGVGRHWGRILQASEGVRPRPGHPAATITRDATAGLALYRVNIGGRPSRARPAPVDVPVQIVVATRDPFIARRTQLAAAGYAPRLWRREIRAGHWVPRTHPRRLARWIAEFADHVEGQPATRALRRAEMSRTAKPFRGHLVVVTGAGSGIGRAVALAFAGGGAEIVAADLDVAAAGRTCDAIAAHGGVAHAYQVDVAAAGEMERFAAWVRDSFGVPDVVVNNAGMAVAGPFLAHTEEDWRRIVDVNLLGVMRGCRLFGAQMAERGEGGHLVNVASAAAFAPSAMLPAYAATKAAVRMLSECLRAELADAGIGVTAICPGFTNTGIATAARYVGVDKPTQERLRSGAARAIALRNYPPEKVALAVTRAVRANRPLVPVNAEARIGYALSLAAPPVLRLAARRSGRRMFARLERFAGPDRPVRPAGATLRSRSGSR